MATLEFAVGGLLLGLSGGLTPGPTTTLVVSETLRHSVREGCKVALAPVLTDGPIILAAMLVLGRLATTDSVIGVIYIAGAAALGYLGGSTLAAEPGVGEPTDGPPRSLLKGVLANASNPHPYLFWSLIGGPILFEAWKVGPLAAASFLVTFYGVMVGSKIALAAVVHRSRGFLNGRAYRIIVRLLGLVLLGFGARFLLDGLRLLGAL